jgi:hypothetical protein
MHRAFEAFRKYKAGWMVGLALAAAAAHAQDSEVTKLRSELRELQQRMQALEKRLEEAEAKPAAPAIPPPAATAPQAATQARSGLAAFNPAISAILAGSYGNFSRDPGLYRLSGFAIPADAAPPRRGFSLGESELTFSANVDHKFAGVLTFAMSADDSVEVEEAYGALTGAPFGMAPKLGRFLSAAGYLNEQHAHAWDFADTPLAYQAFLGGQYRTDGAQVRWVAPSEHYIEIGGEIGNGDAFPGTPRNRNGVGSSVLFARTGGDVGASHSWLAGVSYLHARPEGRADIATDGFGGVLPAAFSGRSDTVGAQFVWKYAPNGNPTHTNLKVQGEYFWRREKGDLAAVDGPPIEGGNSGPFSSRQGGGYVQAVYQWMPTWRAGLRYDRLDAGDRAALDPRRTSAMVDWSPSEFSRVRLQVARAKLAPGFTDNELFVQYILSLGAHGAHKY